MDLVIEQAMPELLVLACIAYGSNAIEFCDIDNDTELVTFGLGIRAWELKITTAGLELSDGTTDIVLPNGDFYKVIIE